MRLLCALVVALAAPLHAAPTDYILQPEASTVGFETDFGPDKITGKMPVTKADLTLDFDKVANSTVDVVLDVSAAKASFPFAAQALKGPKVLDAASHPQMTFRSTSVKASGNGARVEGMLTIRGITQPVVLNATLFQQQGSAKGDYSHLTIRLTGAVKRSAFGATGWSDLVGDEVRISITARIAQVE